MERAPSPKILLNRFGNLNAILTQSPMELDPNVVAMKNSLAKPNILDIAVKNVTIIPDLRSINFLNNYQLLFRLFE